MAMSPISDLRVRVKISRDDFDRLIESYSTISRIADETGNPDLIAAAAEMGMMLGRVGHEVVEVAP